MLTLEDKRADARHDLYPGPGSVSELSFDEIIQYLTACFRQVYFAPGRVGHLFPKQALPRELFWSILSFVSILPTF